MSTPSPQSSKGQRRQASPRTPATPSSTAPSRARSVSASDAITALIARRAYERYVERGYRHGCALDDWLEAEREVMSQAPPV